MSRGVCEIEGCDRPHCARGWCKRHWDRWARCGDPRGRRRVDFAPLDDAPPHVLADRYGVHRRSIHRWRIEGIPVRRAEALAEAAGRHPLELWPDLYA